MAVPSAHNMGGAPALPIELWGAIVRQLPWDDTTLCAQARSLATLGDVRATCRTLSALVDTCHSPYVSAVASKLVEATVNRTPVPLDAQRAVALIRHAETVQLPYSPLQPNHLVGLNKVLDAAHRLRTLDLSALRPDCLALLQRPGAWGARIDQLQLSFTDLTPHEAAALGLRNFPQLRALSLANNALGAQGIAALGLAECAQLQALVLAHNNSPWRPHDWSVPIGLPPSLQVLDLSGTSLGEDGIAALPWTQLAGLRKLRLDSTDLANAGARALGAAMSTLGRLRELSMERNNLVPDDLATLSLARLPTLEALYLGHNRLYGQGLASLAWPQTLRVLRLRANSLGEVGVQAVVGALLPALAHLDLSRTLLNGDAIGQLRQARWPNLTHLNLADNHMNEAGAAALGACLGQAPHLRSLDVSNDGVTVAEVGAFAPHLPPGLRALHMDGNLIRNAGMRAVPWTRFARLETLSLAQTEVRDEAVRALPPNVWATLTHLELSGNTLGPQSAAALRNANPSALRELRLTDNLFSGAGLLHLACAKLPALELLYVDGNGLTDTDVDVFFRTRAASRTRLFVSLSRNQIAYYQAIEKRWRHLAHVVLSDGRS